MTPEEIRNAVCDAAAGCVGLRSDAQSYRDFIAPDETPARQATMAKMSGCALTVAGIWRRAGLHDQRLESPYKDGQAVSRLSAIAHSSKAWHPFKENEYPQPGDMVLIGDNTPSGGYEHVYTIIKQVSDGLFDTVDGGQLDIGLQCIKAKRHKWTGRRDRGLASNDPGSNVAGGRIIIGWIDVTLLPFTDNPYC